MRGVSESPEGAARAEKGGGACGAPWAKRLPSVQVLVLGSWDSAAGSLLPPLSAPAHPCLCSLCSLSNK